MKKIILENIGQSISLSDGEDYSGINSINVFIGNNGSGKTKTIKNIINTISEKKYDIAGIDLKGDFGKTKIIYFTPSPYHEKIKSNRIFFDSSKIARHASLENITSFDNILPGNKNFIPQVKISCNLRSLCSKLFYAVLNENFDISDCHPLFEIIINLKKHLPFKSNAHVTNFDIDNKSIFYKKNFLRECIDYIKHRINDQPEILPALCFLDRTTASKSIFFDNFIKILDNDYFGAPYKLHEIYNDNDFDHLSYLFRNSNVNIEFSADIAEARLNTHEDRYLIDSLITKGIAYHSMGMVSSGEACLYNQILIFSEEIRKHKYKGKDVIVFIDEGDMLLHISWQRNYITIISDLMGKLKNQYSLNELHLIFATHSPFLVSDISGKHVVNFNENYSGERVKSFGVPVHLLIQQEFGGELIGDISCRKIEKIISEGDINSKYINEIEDEFLRNAIINEIGLKNDNKNK